MPLAWDPARQHSLLLVSFPPGRPCLITDRNGPFPTPSLARALCWDSSQLDGLSKNLHDVPFAFSVTLSPPYSLIPGASLLRERGGPVVGQADLRVTWQLSLNSYMVSMNFSVFSPAKWDPPVTSLIPLLGWNVAK